MSGGIIAVMLFFSIFVFIYTFKAITIIKHGTVGVVERLGRALNHLLEPGFNLINPVIDKVYIVNIEENTINMSKIQAISKTGENIEADATITYKITAPLKAVYAVNNLTSAIQDLVENSFKLYAQEYPLENLVVFRVSISENILAELSKKEETWGCTFINVTLTAIRDTKSNNNEDEQYKEDNSNTIKEDYYEADDDSNPIK